MNTMSLRIAVSPLHELIGALRLLFESRLPLPSAYASWARRAAPALARLGRLRVYSSPGLPAAFTPVPRSASPSIAMELAVLRAAVPVDVPASLRAYAEPSAFGLLADALAEFWEAAVAPYWSALRASLNLDVQMRSLALAAEGPEAVLASLRLAAPPHRRILLVPTTFKPGPPVLDDDVMMLPYRSALTPALDPSSRSDRLTPLLGAARASLLRALAAPTTTTGLAASLGYAPSSISAQLAILVECGLAARRRTGQRVLYFLAPTGRALLAWLQ